MDFLRFIYTVWVLSFAYFQGSSQNSPLALAYGQGKYEECITLSDAEIETNKDNATAYYFRGAAKVNLKKYHAAKDDIGKALALNFANANAANAILLRAEAGLKESDMLLKRLDSLAKVGYAATLLFGSDEFDYLENDHRFQRLKIEVDKNANPCKYDMRYKKLDFWIGAWDVYTNGNKTADSYITKSEGGCTLHEDYRTLNGFDGRSLNYYDSQDSLYTQIWIDKFNSIIHFKEERAEDGILVLRAETPNGNLVRMSYRQNKTNDTVTQTMEASTDQGINWASNFLGIYKRKN